MAEITGPRSVSRIRLEIEVRSKGVVIAELARHLAPLTCSTLLKGLPIEGGIHRFADKFLYLESNLTIGAEKNRTFFKRGDLAVMPSNGAVCFFVKDGSTPPLNPIGYITSNLEIFDGINAGDSATIKRSDMLQSA